MRGARGTEFTEPVEGTNNLLKLSTGAISHRKLRDRNKCTASIGSRIDRKKTQHGSAIFTLLVMNKGTEQASEEELDDG
jgi:hypothetical protein